MFRVLIEASSYTHIESCLQTLHAVSAQCSKVFAARVTISTDGNMESS